MPGGTHLERRSKLISWWRAYRQQMAISVRRRFGASLRRNLAPKKIADRSIPETGQQHSPRHGVKGAMSPRVVNLRNAIYADFMLPAGLMRPPRMSALGH
jgi:hypothetical protein